MAKRCVFCGSAPTEKTKEHVIPAWLIRLTGDPNRVVNLGYSKNSDVGWKPRGFAFDQLTFPSCASCNARYSGLEDSARSIVERVLAGGAIKGFEASTLLDWFDKVRVGLWLGFNQLDKNYAEVTPNFHIGGRIGKADRVLVVEKTDFSQARSRLTFAGVDTYSFAMTPSVFRLSINAYSFTNVSFAYLVSRRLGFPYPKGVYLSPDRQEMFCPMRPGRHRVMTPVLPQVTRPQAITLYQPMFPGGAIVGSAVERLYDTPYVHANVFDFAAGTGAVYVARSSRSLAKLDRNEDFFVRPPHLQDDWEVFQNGAVRVLQLQNWVTEIPSVDQLSASQKQYVALKKRTAARVNNLFIQAAAQMSRP